MSENNASQGECPDCTGGVIDTSGYGDYDTCEECGGSGRAALASTPSPLQVAPAKPEKIAPVQGYTPGIPWSLHLEAYDAYCRKWGAQPALIDLEGRGCRGGFGTRELDDFIPGWRDRVSEIGKLRAEIVRLTADLAASQVAQPAVRVPLSKKEALAIFRAVYFDDSRLDVLEWQYTADLMEACAKKWGVPLSSEKGDGRG